MTKQGAEHMNSFEAVIDEFAEKTLLVIGDLMLDRFVYGSVTRISPEAPAPVINTSPPDEIIGGAGNVARNIAALGARCDLVAIVGRDDAARSLRRRMAASPEITPTLIELNDRPTTLKTRFVAHLHNTHLLRADSEDTAPIGRETENRVLARIERLLPGADAVILSDYNKGVLTPRVTAKVIELASVAGKSVIVDPKGIEYERYKGATVLTPNLGELAQALGRPIQNEEAAVQAGAQALMRGIDCETVLVTRGERGVLVVDRHGASSVFDATAKRVIDVSGAGDTLVASFTLALISNAGTVNAARLANAAAGIVVGKKGTSQVTADELRSALLSRPHFELREKIHDPHSLERRVAAWRRDGLTIGFTNGCFDLLHPGHVHLLCEARSYCDRLVVGLNSDTSVKRLKGPARPVQPETARSFVLAGLAFVDAVTLFDQDTPIELIEAIKPDILLKGADYNIDGVIGREIVQSYGGRVILVELVPDSSTTQIVDRLRAGAPPNASGLTTAN